MKFAIVKYNNISKVLISYDKKKKVKSKFVLSGTKCVFCPAEYQSFYLADASNVFLNIDKTLFLFSENDLFEADDEGKASDIFIQRMVADLLKISKESVKRSKEADKKIKATQEKSKLKYEKELKERKEKMNSFITVEKTEGKKRGRPKTIKTEELIIVESKPKRGRPPKKK